MHKPVRHHFKKRRVIVSGVDKVWAADLIDMQHYSKWNNGYKYILAAIDEFSKYGWMRPLKSRSGAEVAAVFKNIIDSSGRTPEMVWVDKGKEFYNSHVQKIVSYYSAENEEKSCIVGRWNGTMKSRMFKYFTANNSNKYRYSSRFG